MYFLTSQMYNFLLNKTKLNVIAVKKINNYKLEISSFNKFPPELHPPMNQFYGYFRTV